MGVSVAGGLEEGELRLQRDRLIEQYLPLVTSLARRYADRGERLDDLVQVGAIGLINAVDRFDAQRGVDLRAYATPSIVGEIKRHLRDRTSTIRLPRREQEARGTLRRARRELRARLDRAPTWAELLSSTAIREEDLARAVDAERATAPLSLSLIESGPMVDEEGFAAGEDRALLRKGFRALEARERRALSLSYFADLSQREVAARLGVSQSEVSRTIARALVKMRVALAGAPATFVRGPSSA
jgi:RNA polymerase sigma-B factor